MVELNVDSTSSPTSTTITRYELDESLKNKMKLLFIILLEFFSLCADAQTISSIVIDWVDTQVETHCDLMILSESYPF